MDGLGPLLATNTWEPIATSRMRKEKRVKAVSFLSFSPLLFLRGCPTLAAGHRMAH